MDALVKMIMTFANHSVATAIIANKFKIAIKYQRYGGF